MIIFFIFFLLFEIFTIVFIIAIFVNLLLIFNNYLITNRNYYRINILTKWWKIKIFQLFLILILFFLIFFFIDNGVEGSRLCNTNGIRNNAEKPWDTIHLEKSFVCGIYIYIVIFLQASLHIRLQCWSGLVEKKLSRWEHDNVIPTREKRLHTAYFIFFFFLII